MSIHLNWIATEDADALLLEALGLQEIGASFDAREAAFACALTPKGWRVVVGQSMKLKLDRLLPTVSAEREVLAGEVSDIVMLSRLQAWRAAARQWSLTHGPEEGIAGLEIAGEPPPELSGIEARLVARQAEEEEDVDHLFDAPLELGERICGYHPDQPPSEPWILLAPASNPTGPRISALPALIRAELMPALADLGWTVAPLRLPSNGRAYDASRVRDGRLETVTFLWRDNRSDLKVIPSFAMLEGDRPDASVVVSGSVHRYAPSLVQRIRSWRPGRPAKPYDLKVREAVAKARADLPTIDEAIDSTAAAEAASARAG